MRAMFGLTVLLLALAAACGRSDLSATPGGSDKGAIQSDDLAVRDAELRQRQQEAAAQRAR